VSGWPGNGYATFKRRNRGFGAGFRGGSWGDSANYLRTSDRQEAALASAAALNTFGGRGVRTYDGN